MENKVILELEHLKKYFGGVSAVDDVSLKIRSNEIHGLIGPNGAGKSTIFKLIMGLLTPSGGKVYFEGKDITHKKTWQRARAGIGIKMQIPGIYLELPLRDNLRIAAQAYLKPDEIEDEISRIIEFVNLKDVGNPIAKNMPHGQQQWLEIGMALVCKPKLLLLDEPAAGMGPEETESTAQMIDSLLETGLTILFIDHDMNFVKRIAQTITVLHYGKVFAQGTHEEIENNEEVKEIYLGKV